MTRKAKFNVNILLPKVPDARDACVRRLSDALEAKAGIEAAHLIERPENASQQLCVHFDPDFISLQDVRHFVEQAGAELERKFGYLLADVVPMRPRKARRLTVELSKAEGVLEAVVAPDGAIRIEFDRDLVDETRVAAMIDELTGGLGNPSASLQCRAGMRKRNVCMKVLSVQIRS